MRDLNNIAKQFDIDPEIIEAVILTETSGTGFNPDGTVKMLFEGHVFYSQLKKVGLDPFELSKIYPTICYQEWTKRHYKTFKGEYVRFEIARQIHDVSAFNSASWGLFQLMGFNHRRAGFQSAFEMVNSFRQSEENQIEAGLKYIYNSGLIKMLRAKNWAGFACGYNGAGYKSNSYDIKLQKNYELAINSKR